MVFPVNGSTPYVLVVDGAGNVQNLADIGRGITDTDTRVDYVARTDTQPVYVGRASANTLTSASIWVIERLTYDGSDRVILKQVLTGAWDNRAALGWA